MEGAAVLTGGGGGVCVCRREGGRERERERSEVEQGASQFNGGSSLSAPPVLSSVCRRLSERVRAAG